MNKKLLAIAISVLALAWSPIARSDALIVPIDISGSTPILDSSVLRTVLPMVAERIARLPVGSRIKVFSVGDDKAKPFEINLFVQRDRTREGDSAKELAKQVPAMIEAKMAQLKTNPENLQGESSLTPAFLDASKWCQQGKPCQIVFLTDGMEYQPGVIAWPVEYKNRFLSSPVSILIVPRW
jgi:hypothetical protein